jgi:outer membrane protein OmpA-like peptidoglycan-associated protein
MRKSFLMLTTALAVSMAGSAQAGTGWYVGLSGGANWVEDTAPFGVNPGPDAIVANTEYEFDTGWIVTGAIGYKWASNWRAEFELGYRSNDGEVVIGGVTVPNLDLEMNQFTQFLNVLYDYPVSDKWNLSVGVGIGGALVEYDESPAFGFTWDEDYVLAGQMIAQLGYEVHDRLDLYVDYRYTLLDEPEFVSAPLGASLGFNADQHSVMVGLRYDLSPDTKPAVYVPPPTPPQPVAPKQFIVFFGFNKSNLTSDAQRVVAEAAAAAKQSGSASILVTGHTDTVGSNRYNDRLSMRRANAVKDELVRQGIGAGQISAIGKGETELLVQTGDNVKEPQNRRATIDLN